MNNSTLFRRFGVALGTLALMAPLTMAQAQDTTAAQQRDTSMAQARDTGQQQAAGDTMAADTSKWGGVGGQNPDVQNPPGYRGMERPVNVFPPDTGAQAKDTTAGAVEDRVTGTYEDTASKDTTGARTQNPPGYRGMERPAGLGDTTTEARALTQQEIDQYTRRLNQAGYKVEKMSKSEKKEWQKKQGKSKKEKGKTEKTEKKAAEKQQTQRSADTTSTVRVGQDTTADTARFGANTNERDTTAAAGAGAQTTGQDRETDIIHQEREAPPGVGAEPAPTPADSERVWVEQRPSGDSVPVPGAADTSRD